MDVENELKELLRSKAEEMSLPPEIPGQVAGRARRRRLVNGLVTGTAVAALLIGGSVGVRFALGSNPIRPADPSPSGVSPTPPATVSPSPTVSATPSIITLEASLDDGPVVWEEVAFIPVGAAEHEVGIDPCLECEPVLSPSAFAVDDDATFWILDPYKARVLHVSSGGALLEAIPVREKADRGGLAVVGGDVYVLLDGGQGSLARVAPDGTLERTTVNDPEAGPVEVGELIGRQPELVGLIVDGPARLGGFWAFATIDFPSGQITPAPGLQVPDGRFMSIDITAEPVVRQVIWSDGTQVTDTREIRFQLTRDGKPVETTAGEAFAQTATENGIATVIGLGDGGGMPVGIWYLSIPSDGSIPVLERIPEDGQLLDPFRRLALGPDGAVYRMLVDRDGVHLLRRPEG